MLQILKVQEDSMSPSIQEGDFVLVLPYIFSKPSIGDVVVVQHPDEDMLLIKRIKGIKNGQYWVEGDNEEGSLDSRNFGPILRSGVIGKTKTIARKGRG